MTQAVGVLGVGAMGAAIAARMLAAGREVWVHDRVPERVAACRAEGARAAADARELAERVDVLIVVVTDAAEIDQALFSGMPGERAAFAAAPSEPLATRVGTVLLCSTISPSEVEAIAARLQGMGLSVLDTPMSGGPARARAGTMSLMVAGAAAVRQVQAGLLEQMAHPVIDLGERLGDAARMKLVNNLLAATHLAAAAEAWALAERVGLEPQRVLDLVSQSSGQSWIADERLARHLAARKPLGSSAMPALPVQARLALLAKDSALARRMADDAGVLLQVTAPAIEAFAQAAAQGWSELDDAHLVDQLAGRTKPTAA